MAEENIRSLPQSDLDLNLMLTDSVWGRPEVSPDLKDKLSTYFQAKDKEGKPLLDKDGNILVTKNSLWGLLGFFTRDMRLGNLSSFDNELNTCRYMIDLANDFLSIDMIEPFLVSLSRSATILETSQSKAGFLRRLMNTLRQEHINTNLDPPKKTLFGGKKNDLSGGRL